MLHEFYYKDVASKSVINARSALPRSCKRTILTQEVLRILLNCSRELLWEAIVDHVNYNTRVDQKFREEVVRSALASYNRLLELDASGEKPLYRPREWTALERAREGRKRPDNWFRTGDFDTVIFVPATPGSSLNTGTWERSKPQHSYKFKVVEQSGTTFKTMLQTSDPFKQRRCVNADCLLCRTDGKGSCGSTGVTYEWFARLVNRSMSEKRPHARILVVEMKSAL